MQTKTTLQYIEQSRIVLFRCQGFMSQMVHWPVFKMVIAQPCVLRDPPSFVKPVHRWTEREQNGPGIARIQLRAFPAFRNYRSSRGTCNSSNVSRENIRRLPATRGKRERWNRKYHGREEIDGNADLIWKSKWYDNYNVIEHVKDATIKFKVSIIEI